MALGAALAVPAAGAVPAPVRKVAAGSIAGWSWTQNGVVVGTGPTVTLSRKIGPWVFILTVTDDDGATDTDEVAVTVTRR